MNKFFFIVIVFFILCLNVNAKTYYVDAENGSKNNSGTSETTAWRTLEEVNGHAFSSGDIIKLSGVFMGQALDLDGETGVIVEQWEERDQAIIDGTGLTDSDPCRLFGINCTLSGLIFQNAEAGRQNLYVRGTGNNIKNCTLRNPSAGAANVKFGGEGLSLFENNTVEGGGSNQNIIMIDNSASVNIFYNIIFSTDSTATSAGALLKIGGTSGTVNIYNNIIFGGNGGIILINDSPRTTNVFNNILGPSNIEHPYNGSLVKGYGEEATIVADYNMLIPNATHQEGQMLDYLTGEHVTDGGHNIIDTPYFTKYPYEGYLIIGVDDGDYLYAGELADLVAAYGGRISWFICHRSTYDGGHPSKKEIAEGEAMVARLAEEGHDIGCHTWSHSKLNDYNAMQIVYKGTGACTLSISNKTLSIDAQDDQYDVSMILSGKSCRDVIDTISTVGDEDGYTISMVTFEGTVQQFSHAQATSLADVSSQSITTQYTMLFDFNRWKVDETDDTIEWIEAISGMPEGYSVTTFAAPYNSYDENWLSYIRAKFSSARSGGSSFFSTQAKNIDLHEIGFLESNILFGPSGTYSDDQIRARARWLGERLSMHGGVVCLFAHNENETSIGEWSLMLEEIMSNYSKVQLVSMKQFYDIVVAPNSGWTKSDNLWSKDIKADYDFRLTAGSPCIDAGKDLDLLLDIDGCSIPQGNTVDIGTYEYGDQCFEQTTSTVPATTTVFPACPVASILKNDKKDIAVIRKFRRDVLLKTPEGRKLVRLYYRHVSEIIQIMELSAAVKNRVSDLINTFLSNLSSTDKFDTTPETIKALTDLCDAIAAEANFRLRIAAEELKKEIEKGQLFVRLKITNN